LHGRDLLLDGFQLRRAAVVVAFSAEFLQLCFVVGAQLFYLGVVGVFAR
jgi:hypothetical protein